jgi:hypothetical protein
LAQSYSLVVVLEPFLRAGHLHQPKSQSLQPEMLVEKLQRGIQKYALQQLDLENFEVCGMEEAQLSLDRLELGLACT